MRRAKEKVGEMFNCHVNKLSQTIVAGHLSTVHKVVFKIALNMVEEFDGKKETRSTMKISPTVYWKVSR